MGLYDWETSSRLFRQIRVSFLLLNFNWQSSRQIYMFFFFKLLLFWVHPQMLLTNILTNSLMALCQQLCLKYKPNIARNWKYLKQQLKKEIGGGIRKLQKKLKPNGILGIKDWWNPARSSQQTIFIEHMEKIVESFQIKSDEVMAIRRGCTQLYRDSTKNCSYISAAGLGKQHFDGSQWKCLSQLPPASHWCPAPLKIGFFTNWKYPRYSKLCTMSK